MKYQHPAHALIQARDFIPPMRSDGSGLYYLEYPDHVSRETLTTPPASRYTTRHWRQQIVLQAAAHWAGGLETLAPLAKEGGAMTLLERLAFGPMLRAAKARNGKPGRHRPPVATPARFDPLAECDARAERWRVANEPLRLAKRHKAIIQAAEALPPAPDNPAALSNARALLAVHRPGLPPAAREDLARFMASIL